MDRVPRKPSALSPDEIDQMGLGPARPGDGRVGPCAISASIAVAAVATVASVRANTPGGGPARCAGWRAKGDSTMARPVSRLPGVHYSGAAHGRVVGRLLETG